MTWIWEEPTSLWLLFAFILLVGPLHILFQAILTACEPYTSKYFLTRGRPTQKDLRGHRD